MKNFSELLATDLKLNVCVNGQSYATGLHDCLTFNATDNVTVDDIEILPKYSYLANDGKLILDQSFYCWYHQVSAQGWLLTPH